MPPPDWLDLTLPNNPTLLLTDDGSLTVSNLAQSLNDQGWNVVVLSFPLSFVPNRSPLPSDVSRVELVDLSEAHLQQQLAAIANTYGSIAAFIHLHPRSQPKRSVGIRYSEIDKAIVKQVFLMAKHLKSFLNAAAQAGHSCFYAVTRLDGAFGLEHKMNFDVISAGLFGLTKSLNQEWNGVFCRAIDLSPDVDATQSAQYIVAELYDPDRCTTEVAYGSQGRTMLTTYTQFAQ